VPPRPEKAPWWLREAALILLGVALVAAYVIQAGASEVATHLQDLSVAAIALAVAVNLLGWVPRIASYHAVAASTLTGTSWRQSAHASLAANGANLVLPARLGDVALVVDLSRRATVARSIATVAAWRALSTLALLLLAGATLAALLVPRLVPWPAWAILAAAFLIGFGLVVFVAQSGTRLAATWMRRRADRFATAVGQATTGPPVLLPMRALAASLLAASLAWALEVASAAVVLASLAPATPWPHIVMASLAGLAAKALRFTPGGIGLYEGMFAGVLWGLGVEGSTAVTAGILSGLVSNLVTLALGARSAAGLLGTGSLATLRHLRERPWHEAAPAPGEDAADGNDEARAEGLGRP